MIIISGPSGAGKGTLIEGLMERCPGLCVAVSATTRPMRAGEVDGREYHFMDAAEFGRQVDAGEFLEHVVYAGNRYGTLRSEVRRHLDEGRSVVLEIELRGARAVRAAVPDAVSVFIGPPNFEELARRLRARATEADEEILRRLEESRTELAAMAEFDHRVVNDEVGRATEELIGIVCAETGARE